MFQSGFAEAAVTDTSAQSVDVGVEELEGLVDSDFEDDEDAVNPQVPYLSPA